MENMIDEIKKLHEMLTDADIPHTFGPLYDGMQIRVYADAEMTNELDDCVIHSGSHGHQNGLLETFCLNGCEGWETAEDVFKGWTKMYNKANQPKDNHIDTCDCTIIGADGEVWEGSAPSWD